VPQYHVDPSPSINHVFVEDCSNDEDFDHEEVDFDSSEEDYAGGSKFFTSPMVAAPPVPVVYPTGTQPAPVTSPTCVDYALVAAPALSAPVDDNVPLAATTSNNPEPSPST
jgi:hypothetical protein